MFEGAEVTAKTQLHLDRCLTCRNCESTCPSGVEYGKLLDIGRNWVEAHVSRSTADKLQRATLGTLISNPTLFTPLLKLGQALRPLMPRRLKMKIPQQASIAARPARTSEHARRMLLLEGCVQPALAPNINAAATRVLDRLGITLFTAPAAGCCGAVTYHLNDYDGGLNAMCRNIDAWLPHLEAGAEAIVMTASGCGVMVKEYGWHLRHDPAYADKAARVSAATKDLSEVVLAEGEKLETLLPPRATRLASRHRIAFHPPCTLQHGQKITGVVEVLLARAGFELTAVPESHLCCGSAGTYSLLQPEIAGALQTRKLANLQSGTPDMIVTANIGCLTHLQSGTSTPVRHWVELLEELFIPGQ